MSEIFGISTLMESTLWSLIDDTADHPTAALKANLVSVCKEASQRMKLALQYFPQFTLHDEQHLLRMVELVPLIAGEHIKTLNAVEIALTILGVFFHDIGMVPTHDEYTALSKSVDFCVFTDRWRVNHPAYGEVMKQLENSDLSKSESERCRKLLCEFDQATLTDYLRERHAFASGEYVRNLYETDKRLEIYGVNLADFVARVCMSHGMSVENINPGNGFHYDEQIGRFQVNLSYISLLVRLADILDFDRERTPDGLFQSVHFTSPISVGEWEKHRAVHGWTIDQTLLRYTMYFEYPVYENIARKFLDMVDNELVSCHMACANYPEKHSQYKIQLPQRVDRSRVGAKNESYIYFDLEFSLSRNEIVNLLLTHNLYGTSSLCVRELLQNSADALRMRRAQFKQSKIEWRDGKISFEHNQTADGIEVLKCQDNGVGMDEDIICNYFTKVGRSYYKSPEFLQKKLSFREDSADFDPCSQFGIGLMSCFMIGDRIIVETRKDYGLGKEHGTPLVVEINGTGGIISIRKGGPTQPIGTTVYIYGRKKPVFFDVWTDRIKLTTVLRGYALAIEFPISAKCAIPELAEECQIAPEIVPFPSLLEANCVQNIKIYSVSLSKYGDLLNGVLQESFLTNSDGIICLGSDEGEWVPAQNVPSIKGYTFKRKGGGEFESRRHRNVTICLDGVLVAGSPGRPGYPAKVSHLLGWHNSGIYAHASCCLDVRGDLKPEITPARIPVKNSPSNLTPRWNKIKDVVGEAECEVWTQLATDLRAQEADPEIFWRLSAIYSVNLMSMSVESVRTKLLFPKTGPEESVSWHPADQLGELGIQTVDGKWVLVVQADGKQIKQTSALKSWVDSGTNHPVTDRYITNLLLAISVIRVKSGKLSLRVDETLPLDSNLVQHTLEKHMMGIIVCIRYDGDVENHLSIGLPFTSANRAHPLTKLAISAKYFSTKDAIQDFATSLVNGLSQAVRSEGEELDCDNRWKKLIGCKYMSVDWSRYDSSYKPPFKVRLRNGTDIEVSDQMLKEWQSLTVDRDKSLEQVMDNSVEL